VIKEMLRLKFLMPLAVLFINPQSSIRNPKFSMLLDGKMEFISVSFNPEMKWQFQNL
jgi:hypothetical protein